MLNDILKSLGDVRVTQLGCIKIGGLGESRPKNGGGTWRLPRKDDHFTITTMNRTTAGDLVEDKPLMQQLLSEYADDDGKLRQIPVRVLSDDIDDILQADYAWYGRKSCGARSDGKTVTWYACPNPGPGFGAPYKPPIVEPWQEEPMLAMRDTRNNPLFKLHGTFNCVIAAKESRFGGVYRFRTTSLISVKQLYSSLLHVSQLTGGVLIGMPLVLVVRPQRVSPNGQATTVYTVHVELRGRGIMELQQQAVQQMQYMLENKQRMMTAQAEYRKLLAAPESKEEAAAIADEFHPEAQELAPAPEDYLDIDGVTNDPAATGGDAKAAPAPSQHTGEDASKPESASRGDGSNADRGMNHPSSPSNSPSQPQNGVPNVGAEPTSAGAVPTQTPARGRGKTVQGAADAPSGNAGHKPSDVGIGCGVTTSAAPVSSLVSGVAEPVLSATGTDADATPNGEPSPNEQAAIAFSEQPADKLREYMARLSPVAIMNAREGIAYKGPMSKASESDLREFCKVAKINELAKRLETR